MKRGLLLAAALSVSCAPAGADRQARPPAVTPREPAQANAGTRGATQGGAADPAEAALQNKLREALVYVSQVRQLPPKAEVQGRLISSAEVATYLERQLSEDIPADVMQATEALLYGFGTVDASFDFRQSVIELMKAQLLGFYDPKQKTFFVGAKLTGTEADITLWHELVHALQDQHYDLSRLTQWQPDIGDSQAAAHALAEGDATSAMIDAMMKPRGMTALDLDEGLMRAESVLGIAASSAPAILVRSLVAPYVDGLAFANGLRRRGGFAAVDSAWRALPVSTEQILHLDKYLAAEPPLVVALPQAPPHAPELRERFHDVMGEQTVRLLLEEWLPARTAAEAASGWGGDRIAVFSDDARKRWALAWHLR
ncbi:MAG TPA: hypothetical protein VEX18_21740, partial [Polyangiaceae bacterium]|nr:hypothetical protein [Polyangiaceae bacterium]